LQIMGVATDVTKGDGHRIDAVRNIDEESRVRCVYEIPVYVGPSPAIIAVSRAATPSIARTRAIGSAIRYLSEACFHWRACGTEVELESTGIWRRRIDREASTELISGRFPVHPVLILIHVVAGQVGNRWSDRNCVSSRSRLARELDIEDG